MKKIGTATSLMQFLFKGSVSL